MKLKITKIGILGMGYVGLPLAIEFSRKFPIIGLDNFCTGHEANLKKFSSL